MLRRLFLRVFAPAAATLPAAASGSKTVKIVEFDAAGKRVRTVAVPKVEKTEAEWRAMLTPLAFQVTRKAGTELAGTGKYNKNKADGIYSCICCGTALFDAKTKYESGTGWPSFWAPIAKENVALKTDRSLGMVRTEVECARCDAHLGHVFPDGPEPTGERYCMNSVSLNFTPRAK